MKEKFDQRMKARVPQLMIVKQEQKNKATPKWNPNPYIVTSTIGSMVTVSRDKHTITRNSSFFKLLYWDDDDEDDQRLGEGLNFSKRGEEHSQLVQDLEISETPTPSIQQPLLKVNQGLQIANEASTSANTKVVGRPTTAQVDNNKQSIKGKKMSENTKGKSNVSVRRSEHIRNQTSSKTGGKM
ncbi:hypothetical protein BpHYR1_035412 [Brachionus plicatilis]|uniref:Uncharacterized protein n=1 Tax=Brachionus plicatilis TaxID=10195 RepID=A0A3M7R2V4_BRAPC|nr:hypothetical protein BpHYR1_035412 [Brachionus plicatilis]